MLEEEFELGVVNIFAWCPVLLLVALKMSVYERDRPRRRFDARCGAVPVPVPLLRVT